MGVDVDSDWPFSIENRVVLELEAVVKHDDGRERSLRIEFITAHLKPGWRSE